MTPSDSPSAGGGPGPVVAPTFRRADDPGAPFAIDVRLSAAGAWAAIAVFLAAITIPAVWRECSGDGVRGTLAGVFRPGPVPVAERLRAVERRIDEGAWMAPVRERMQTALYRTFREGNRKVLVGRDGWLFHRPGVQALTGRGPVLGPTHSVAKDPALRDWEGPIPVIREFAAQLRQRGIRLVLVPVPDKAAVHSAHLAGPGIDTAPSRRHHPDWPGFVEALRGSADVIDLTGALPYLPHDTHWEAAGARSAAAAVAVALRPDGLVLPEPAAVKDLTGQGDLVASLGLTDRAAVGIQTALQAPLAPPATSDPEASVVLLGDSNVNMYDDPGLPLHQPGAGFASWLSACLKEPLHVIAINGGGATQVRQRFAALPDDVVRAKKTVVWVLAERDLFMDPAVARSSGVDWKRVVFNPKASSPETRGTPAEALVVEATLRAKSELIDMNSVVYRDAVFTAEFAVHRVVAGTYAPRDLMVVLWNFRDRVSQPPARFAPGQLVRLTLIPFPEQGDLAKMPRTDDFLRFDLPLFFAEKAEPISE